MPIDLSDFEDGRKYDGDYAADLLALQERLARIQVAHIVRGRSAIIAFEGWDASGKGGAISRLTSSWDPRWFEVWPIGAPTEEERVRHFLWRFWKRLPGKGEINIFDRTWYGRVLVERVEGFCSEAEWKRAYDEINEFEAQQKDNGVTLVKLFMHVTQDEQDKRLKERLEDPWKRWKTGAEDYRNRARRHSRGKPGCHPLPRHRRPARSAPGVRATSRGWTCGGDRSWTVEMPPRGRPGLDREPSRHLPGRAEVDRGRVARTGRRTDDA